MKKKYSAALHAIMLLALLVGAAVPGKAGADELTFGMSAAFSGATRGLGVEYYRGIMAYLSHVNEHGGVNGHTFAVKAYDDGYNPGPCVRNTIRLIEEDEVFALLNYVGTPTTTRMLPVLMKFADRNMFLLFPLTGAEPLRSKPYGKYVFNLRASYFDETIGLVDHFVSVGRKRLAVFYQADAYGRNGWDGVRHGLETMGMEMVAEVGYKRGSTYEQDYTGAVELLRQENPDAVIMVGAYAACAGFVRDARLAGLDVPIASVSFSDADNILGLLDAEGARRSRCFTDNLVFSNVVPSYEDMSLPAVRLYRRLMTTKAPMPPADLMAGEYRPHEYSFVSFEGFLNGIVLVEMIRRMEGPPTRDKIEAAMYSLKELDIGLGEPVRFEAGSNQGLHKVYYTQVKDGRLLPMRDWSRWGK